MNMNPLFEMMKKDASPLCFPMVGIVTNNKDPEGLGRVKVKLPYLGGNESNWARVGTFMGGREKGAFFLPEVGEETLVIFEFGDITRPYVIASLWNGQDVPPEKNQDGKNNRKLMKFRSGITIEVWEEQGKERVTVSDKTKKNKIEMDLEKKKITIQSEQDIQISAPEGKLSLVAKQIEMKSTEATKLQAQEMALKASSDIKVKGSKIYLN